MEQRARRGCISDRILGESRGREDINDGRDLLPANLRKANLCVHVCECVCVRGVESVILALVIHLKSKSTCT